MLSKQQVAAFQIKILDWYELHQRDLPWRKIRDPYSILVSEVMSQQTQLSRVVPKYEAWMQRFPTVRDLAKASIAEVLQFWSGLGYNRRALNLKKTAEIITTNYRGTFPKTEKELMSLPGIGQYTARAVLCFAFDVQVAVVDTNVRKVIMTQILNSDYSESGLSLSDDKSQFGEEKIDEKMFEEIATQLLPYGEAYKWNQALMDYAAAVLKKEKIPIPKQSKFIGSHRYYRGQILKVLLQKKKVAMKDLGLLIKKDYTVSEKEWLEKLLEELVREGFVKRESKTVSLAS